MNLDGRHQFSSIVVGQANRLAVAAAQAVAENPGATYSPLYVWSAPGLGKTQLLTAIGLRTRALHPELAVVALTADEFARHLRSAISAGDAEAFHGRLQDTHLLLLDDVQLLAGNHDAQAALLRLCEEFHESGRQIACAGDRPPADITDVDAQLAAHLSGGLVVEIGLNGPAPRASGAVVSPPAAEFLSFISDVATVVARHVEPWRSSIGEATERWASEGYDTNVLQRAMRAGSDPGSDALIATYARCVARLQTLQCEAATIDADLAANDVFFDPARVADAELLLASARGAADGGGGVDRSADDWAGRNGHAVRSNGAGHAHHGAEAADIAADAIELVDIVDAADIGDGGDTIATEAAEPDEPLPVSVVARRTSRGMVITSIEAEDPFFLDDEKVVWDWPDAQGRVIEEFR